jgi:hypothetical protein
MFTVNALTFFVQDARNDTLKGGKQQEKQALPKYFVDCSLSIAVG